VPWATLIANVVGAFLIGVLAARLPGSHAVRVLLGTGVLGGFTTYSAFAVGTVTLWHAQPWLAAAYASAASCWASVPRRSVSTSHAPRGAHAGARMTRSLPVRRSPEARARAALSRRPRGRPPRRLAVPWGVLVINLTGSFALGLITGGFPGAAFIVGAGLLGGYTTFSTAMLDTVALWRDGSSRAAAFNAAGMLLLGILAAIAGLALGAAIAG
jgi:CrcB protein